MFADICVLESTKKLSVAKELRGLPDTARGRITLKFSTREMTSFVKGTHTAHVDGDEGKANEDEEPSITYQDCGARRHRCGAVHSVGFDSFGGSC